MTTDLPVPDEARTALGKWRYGYVDPDEVRAVATPVVAAELRRLSEEIIDFIADQPPMGDIGVGMDRVAQRLDRRANELEAGQ